MPRSITGMKVRIRTALAVSVGVVAVTAGACGVAAPEEAASFDGNSIPASTVDALVTDDAFAALLGFEVSESDAVAAGASARSVLDFLLQGEALESAAREQGLDVEPDDSVVAETIQGLQAQGYEFDVDDLSVEAMEVLSRFLAADQALGEAGQGYGTPTEADLRFAYDALEESGRWERTCVTMIGGPPEAVEEALSAIESGTPLAEVPEEVTDMQLAVDSEVQCATGADLATLPGDLATEVADAPIGEVVGPVEVTGANQPLVVIFTVSERGAQSFEDAHDELEAVVVPSMLAVHTARDADVNPRYGGPVELEFVQGQMDPSTGQQGSPALVARVSRPQAPEVSAGQ